MVTAYLRQSGSRVWLLRMRILLDVWTGLVSEFMRVDHICSGKLKNMLWLLLTGRRLLINRQDVPHQWGDSNNFNLEGSADILVTVTCHKGSKLWVWDCSHFYVQSAADAKRHLVEWLQPGPNTIFPCFMLCGHGSLQLAGPEWDDAHSFCHHVYLVHGRNQFQIQ